MATAAASPGVDGGGGSAKPRHSFFAPIISTNPLLYEKAMIYFKEYCSTLDQHFNVAELFDDGTDGTTDMRTRTGFRLT